MNFFLEDDHCREECGITGVWQSAQTANTLYLSLFALQHRGQEAFGMVTFQKGEHQNTEAFAYKEKGLISESVNQEHLAKLLGTSGLGHVRYSTAGGNGKENIQPFLFRTALGQVSIAHNGNLTNASSLREKLEQSGSVFQGSSDSEVFVHLIAREPSSSMRERIGGALRQVHGAYSLVILTKDSLYAARDPHGLRPLSIGKLKEGGYVIASETCAFDLLGAAYVRDVEPGEVVEVSSKDQISSWFPQNRKTMAFCSFEPIYFARPDSLLFGESIYVRRRRIGEILAKECPADADLVIPIPDSGVAMAEGFAAASGIPFAMGLVRNHYIGRTFIQPDQTSRDQGVRLKLNPVRSVLNGKRVVVVDDSLVRGTTAARILKLVQEAGATDIHFRIGAPPITHSCFYGVDTPERERLLAAQKNVSEIRELLGVKSLGFISVEGLRKALDESKEKSYCMACFTGSYPDPLGISVTRQPTDGKGPGLFSKK